MLPRELFVLATLTTLSVATSAASIDFDHGDYEVFPDTEEKSSDDNDNGELDYFLHYKLFIKICTIVILWSQEVENENG